MSLIFVILFSDIGQCFRPAQAKNLENQKSGHVSLILDIFFSKYKPLNKTSVGCRCATDYRRQK